MKYRAHNWLDIKKCIPLFGIQAKRPEDTKWLHCCEGSDPLLFEDEGARNTKLREFKQKEKV